MLQGISGRDGEIRAGGRFAARLTGWTARRGPGADGGGAARWEIRGGLADAVDFYLDSPARKEVRLTMGERCWRWRDVRIERADGATLIVAYGDFETL